MSPINWVLVRHGDTGERVSAIQYLLRSRGAQLAADGIFGPITESAVRQFQAAHNLDADGAVGSQTWPALIVQLGVGHTGDAVRAVQVLLPPLDVDGIFGPKTEHAVRELQFRFGLSPDGIVGPLTWITLTSIVPVKPTDALIEPDSIAGIGLGTHKSEAYAVLGPPSATGRKTDRTGATYDWLRWEIRDDAGITLNYRTPSVTSPLLTDWYVNSWGGPSTKKGVHVGSRQDEVIAAYGPTKPFANFEGTFFGQGAGLLVVGLIDYRATLIVAGDPEYWSRTFKI